MLVPFLHIFFYILGVISLFYGVTAKYNGWRVMESNNLAIQKRKKRRRF